MDKKKKFFNLIIFVSIVFFIQSVLINQTCYAAGINKKAKGIGSFEKIEKFGSTYEPEPMLRLNDREVLVDYYAVDKYLIYDISANKLTANYSGYPESDTLSKILLKENEIITLESCDQLRKFNFKTKDISQFKINNKSLGQSLSKLDDRYFLLTGTGTYSICDSETMLCKYKGETLFSETRYKQDAMQAFKLNDDELLMRYGNYFTAEIYNIKTGKIKFANPFRGTSDKDAYSALITPATFSRNIYKLKDNFVFSIEEADKSKMKQLKEKIYGGNLPFRIGKFRNKIVIREYKEGEFKVIDEFILDRRIKGSPDIIYPVVLSENEFLIFETDVCSDYKTYLRGMLIKSLLLKDVEIYKKVFYVNTKTSETLRLEDLPVEAEKIIDLKISDNEWLIIAKNNAESILMKFTRNEKE